MLTQFSKEFEIFPYLLNINQLACYWKIIFKSETNKNFAEVFDTKRNLGKFYTLSKFALTLIHFAIIVFYKINQNYYKNFTNSGK